MQGWDAGWSLTLAFAAGHRHLRRDEIIAYATCTVCFDTQVMTTEVMKVTEIEGVEEIMRGRCGRYRPRVAIRSGGPSGLLLYIYVL